MGKINEIAMDVEDLQVVLDNEADFQQKILPELFYPNGTLDHVELKREIIHYVYQLLRENWKVYEYLQSIVDNGDQERNELVYEEMRHHYEEKWEEGCYN
jgi:hypothetical protein